MRLLVLFCLIAAKISAQNNDAIFLFSLTDTNGVDIYSQDYGLAGAVIYSNNTMSDTKLPVSYDPVLQMYVMQIPEEFAGNIIQIVITHAIGNAVEIMNIFYKTAKENDFSTGCYACMCTEVKYQPGNYVFDMPMQKESWELIPDVTKEIRGDTIILNDITMLQNWREQKMK
ncbi:MAG: hypothetical protein H7X71_06830 [Chitinophagales bacterium]|nr:hypothetical protein [Chitinophagales bacterium]